MCATRLWRFSRDPTCVTGWVSSTHSLDSSPYRSTYHSAPSTNATIARFPGCERTNPTDAPAPRRRRALSRRSGRLRRIAFASLWSRSTPRCRSLRPPSQCVTSPDAGFAGFTSTDLAGRRDDPASLDEPEAGAAPYPASAMPGTARISSISARRSNRCSWRRPLTKKVGVPWTPARRPPSASSRTRPAVA